MTILVLEEPKQQPRSNNNPRTTNSNGEIMSKTKFVLGLATVVAMFVVTTSALAIWTPHPSKGKGKAGEGTFTYENGTVKCVTAEGNYKVNSTGTQVKLDEIKWNKCVALGLEAKVECKGLELKQPAKEGTVSGTATGTVQEVCTVVAPGCTITIGPEGNKELKSIALEKSGSNQKDKVEVTGITATSTGSGCAIGGISKPKTTEAKEKVPTLELEGVGLE
jgi:hypothetical protein